MKAARVTANPNGGILSIEEIATPTAGANEVLVRVHATGVNYGETVYMSNHRAGAPMTPGVEFAGEIVEVGAQVTGWRVGDRVMGHGRDCHAEYVLAAPMALMAVPDDVSWIDAAAFPNVFITAHDALVSNANLQAGESVLVTGASGGVGMASIMIAAAMGAKPVMALSRSDEKLQQLREFGVDVGINSANGSIADAVLAATEQRGVDIILDMIGGSSFEEFVRSLAVKGRLVNISRLSGTNMAQLDLSRVWMNRLKIMGVTFRTRTEQERIDCVQACARDLLPHFNAGKLRLPINRTFKLDNLADAYAYIKSGQHLGKIVLTMD